MAAKYTRNLRKTTRALLYQAKKHRGVGYDTGTRRMIASAIRHQRKKLGGKAHRRLYNRGVYEMTAD
jgi:hypothetical protein